MHFSTLTSSLVTLSLAATALADRMDVYTYCFTLACTSQGTFYTDFGSYSVNAASGCRGTSVPGMTEFCVDEKNERAHFKFSHQNFKRCLRVTSSEWEPCAELASCSWNYYTEVPCNWRVADDDGEEAEVLTVSAT